MSGDKSVFGKILGITLGILFDISQQGHNSLAATEEIRKNKKLCVTMFHHHHKIPATDW